MEPNREDANEAAGRDTRPFDRIEEALWVERARRGEVEAFAWLMARHERPLLYYLGRFFAAPEVALDVHQEIWLEVFRKIRHLRVPEAFRGWLYRLAHDQAARQIRQEIRQQRHAEAYLQAREWALPEEEPDPEALHLALARLEPEQREVLTLHYLRDLSLEEIATATACPVGTVKSRLHYARLALRRIMERSPS